MFEPFDATQKLPTKEGEVLEEYLQKHPELKSVVHFSNFISAKNATLQLPPGLSAKIDSDTKLSTSLLPEKQYGIVALYEIDDGFSEIEHLGNRDALKLRTDIFLSKTGLGPTTADVGLASEGHLPKHRGVDLKDWKPYVGAHGYVNVLGDNANNFEKSYYLLVAVPNLPFSNEAIESLSMTPAKKFTQHDNLSVVKGLAQRNANKLAQLFADTFKIELRHRRPDHRSISGAPVAQPIACTLNNVLAPKRSHVVEINSSIGTSQVINNNPQTVVPLSPKKGVVLVKGRVEAPISMPTITSISRKVSPQDIGKTFLAERVFWKSRGKTLAPEVLLYDDGTSASPQQTLAKHGGIPLTPVFLVANQ